MLDECFAREPFPQPDISAFHYKAEGTVIAFIIRADEQLDNPEALQVSARYRVQPVSEVLSILQLDGDRSVD